MEDIKFLFYLPNFTSNNSNAYLLGFKNYDFHIFLWNAEFNSNLNTIWRKNFSFILNKTKISEYYGISSFKDLHIDYKSKLQLWEVLKTTYDSETK